MILTMQFSSTHTSDTNKLFSWAKFAGKTASICRLSNAVTVGNAWLADYARKNNPNVIDYSFQRGHQYLSAEREKVAQKSCSWLDGEFYFANSSGNVCAAFKRDERKVSD